MVCAGELSLCERDLVSNLNGVLSAGCLHVSLLEKHALVKALRASNQYYGYLNS